MTVSQSRYDAAPCTLLDLCRHQARLCPQRRAYTFRSEDGSERTITFGELDRRSRAIASTLQGAAGRGERALLVYPAGLGFVEAFFGCVYAGLLPVPATYPKPRRPMPRLGAIADDCAPLLALTTSQTLATLQLSQTGPGLQKLRWVATDGISEAGAAGWQRPGLAAQDLALLQYTSGSTSEPKGVMVSHANLLHNLEMIRVGFDIQTGGREGPGAGMFWLPAYHDMGLIGGILMAVYTGGHSVLISPTAFLQRPLRWLQAVSDHRAIVSGGPSFAYELCVRRTTPEQRAALDLSNWRVAFCGAEPICAETLREFAEAFAPCGFSAEAFYPCYGLAESTLLAAGGNGSAPLAVKRVPRTSLAVHRFVESDGQDAGEVCELVGCGRALLDQEIVIVNPDTLTRCRPNQVGEIWIKGPSVARGYWNRPEESAQTFAACLKDTSDGPYLRTGDLGSLSEGNLYVTGRLKEMIIVRGRNHYPQDIELTARQCHAALRSAAGAAFSVEAGAEEGVVVVHEVDRRHRNADLQEVIRAVRRAVVEEHELDLLAVLLIRQANLPRTTSGKPQRTLCRRKYLAGELKVLAAWQSDGARSANEPDRNRWAAGRLGRAEGKPAAAPLPASQPEAAALTDGSRSKSPLPDIKLPERPLGADEIERLAEQIETWIVEWLAGRAGVRPGEIDRHRPFAEYGLDSLTAVELSQELEDWLHVRITPLVAWNYPTLATMAGYLARVVGGLQEEDPPAATVEEESAEFEQVLAEIETLSEEEAASALNGDPPRR